MDTPINQPNQPPAKQMRWVGFFMFICGGVLAYLCVISPLLAASRHEDDVSLSLKGVVLSPALVILGAFLFFMGNQKAGRLFGTREEPSIIGVVICVATAGIGILLYVWLKSKLRAYGYAF
jgi:hypothetical protein